MTDLAEMSLSLLAKPFTYTLPRRLRLLGRPQSSGGRRLFCKRIGGTAQRAVGPAERAAEASPAHHLGAALIEGLAAKPSRPKEPIHPLRRLPRCTTSRMASPRR